MLVLLGGNHCDTSKDTAVYEDLAAESNHNLATILTNESSSATDTDANFMSVNSE